jgi:ATP phosphoribosyltransferase
MAAPLVIAVPSKGRLMENANAFFARAGLAVVQPGARSYRGRLEGMEGVEVAFLSAPEIAREVGLGSVHLGITGRDQIEETLDGFDQRVDLTLPLGFGQCDVVVAVPEAWIDVQEMADLDDVAAGFRPRHGRPLRVATKYLHLTRRFFARHGIADYRIVESLGATEGAPATGAADLIVDITTTGATLRANHLKVLADGVILKSEAHLVAGLAADWRGEARAALGVILDRIEAEAAGRTLRALTADAAEPEETARLAAERFGARAPFGAGRPLLLYCPARQAGACADWLRAERGAGTVAAAAVEALFGPGSGAFRRLLARLGPISPAG